jgi:hypothetical protein
VYFSEYRIARFPIRKKKSLAPEPSGGHVFPGRLPLFGGSVSGEFVQVSPGAKGIFI